MTGTAMTEADEFIQIYELGVVPIPTNQPMIRLDEADLIYRTEAAKYTAVIDDLAERNEKGQPVLVGTTSVEKSEQLSNLLRQRGVPHQVLNAKYHEREAASWPRPGARAPSPSPPTWPVVAPTSCSAATRSSWRPPSCPARPVPGRDPRGLRGGLARRPARRRKKAVAAEHEEVVDLGGLYVLGTERHESRRIDNQLRGRSGRQGDPGETRFYLSLEDDLMRLFKADMVDAFLRRFNVPDDVPIEAKMVSNAIRSAQSQVEAQNFEIRKNVLKYDDVLNRQRLVIYDERKRVLEGEDLHEQVRGFLDDTVAGTSAPPPPTVTPRTGTSTSCGLRSARSTPSASRWRTWTRPPAVAATGSRQDFLTEELTADAQAAYDRREEALGARGHARARAARDPVGAGPQVARAPVRDGLPAARASACGPWPSGTRSSSTSARASTCSPR